MQLAAFALENSFSYASTAAEVSVYLERRVHIEHIYAGGMCKQSLNVLADLFAVKKPCPHIDYPCP